MNFNINNMPEIDTFWRGLGGHFDSFHQLMNEFLDNSISNFNANNPLQKNILITLEEANGNINVRIEDTGTGIKDISSTLTIGNQNVRETPMNEHGFGLKHALATADMTNTNWVIYTRTDSMRVQNRYACIKAPYTLKNFKGEYIEESDKNWPGEYNTTGTIIKFTCTKDFFNTVRAGLGGNYGLKGKVNLLAQDIGFTYSELIKSGKANITISFIDINGNKNLKVVPSVDPNWEEHFPPGRNNEPIDLGNGEVLLKYEFGAMNESEEYKKYYKRNMSSSGVEIRINGRLIMYNLFKEIWGIEKHNSYNYLLIKVDIISEYRDRLPMTRTSKNGIRKGDEKLEAVFEWIRSYINKPKKNQRDIDHEVDLFEKLAENKKIHLPEPKMVSLEHKAFNKIEGRIAIDLYIKSNSNVTIYEGKKDKTTIKDVYQLKMYWDGLTIDGVKPTSGILIAAEHPETVIELVKYVNMMKDIFGNNYNLIVKIWREEGIDYPKYN